MNAVFFYRTYSKMYLRGRKLRLSVTPLGFFTLAVCVISGFAGLNIFSADLYKLFSLSFAIIAVSYLSRDKKASDLSHISVNAFFDKRYNKGGIHSYNIILNNESSKEFRKLEVIPVAGSSVPSIEDFIRLREPGEEKRNIWDRKIYYFRWIWHMLRLHKAEFEPLNADIGAGKSFKAEGRFKAVSRGRVKTAGFYIIKKDLFGLFSSYRFYERKETLYIYPAPVKITEAVSKKIRLSLERKSKKFSSSLIKFKAGDFVGLRDYVPGDPVKNIHWKTWAKRDKPVIIEKGNDTAKNITLFLINAAPDSGNELNFENCVSFIYSLVRKFEAEDYDMTLFYFNRNRKPESVTAGSETGNFSSIYNLISEIELHVTDMNGLIKISERMLINSGAMVISPSGDINVRNFCRKNGFLLFTRNDGRTRAENENFMIPDSNTENYQINLP